MTSGQGNEHGDAPEEHGGTPQQQPGWGQPPSVPPYGGQVPPYGTPPGGYSPAPPPPPPAYGGYGPAPSAPPGWGGQAPTPVERPATVRFGLGAFVAELILGLIGGIYVLSNYNSIIQRALDQANVNTKLPESSIRAALIGGAAFALVIVALEVMFIAFAWNGRNWARVVLWVFGGLGIVSGLIGLSTNSQYGGFYATLSIFQWLLTIIGVVLLALKPSNDWFRYRKWRRMTGQG